jgi:hypothetical protein
MEQLATDIESENPWERIVSLVDLQAGMSPHAGAFCKHTPSRAGPQSFSPGGRRLHSRRGWRSSGHRESFFWDASHRRAWRASGRGRARAADAGDENLDVSRMRQVFIQLKNSPPKVA